MEKISARNRAMFELLEKNGYPLDEEALTAPFNFTLCPVTSYGLADGQLIVDFSLKIQKLARKLDFRKVRLNCVLILPVILSPEITTGGRNSSSFRKGTYKVKRHIDFLDVGIYDASGAKKNVSRISASDY